MSLLRLFHGGSGFVRIREMFELGGVELERVHCTSGNSCARICARNCNCLLPS